MNLQAVDYQSPTAAKDFVESLRQTGFGVLKNHPIPKQQVSSIYANWQAFFNSQDKTSFAYNKGKQDGFFPQSVSEIAKGFKKKDIKEYFHYYPIIKIRSAWLNIYWIG
jgi:isopenicillin N synthase-like dioxygenase